MLCGANAAGQSKKAPVGQAGANRCHATPSVSRRAVCRASALCGKWRAGLGELDRCAIMMRCAASRRQLGCPPNVQGEECLSLISFGAYIDRTRICSFETPRKLSMLYSTRLPLHWHAVSGSSCAASEHSLSKSMMPEMAAILRALTIPLKVYFCSDSQRSAPAGNLFAS
jgi:hypothetical protein